jgi:hypothetical protein
LREDPDYQEMALREAEAMEKVAVLLEKKAEGRPLPPEDYDFMANFINRVEKRVEKKRREEDLEEQRRYEEALATVPELTFEINILDVDLKEHILYILQEGGIETLGDLVLQMRLDSDKILALNGIGPKSFEQISELTDGLRVSPEEAAAAEAKAKVEETQPEDAVQEEASEEPQEELIVGPEAEKEEAEEEREEAVEPEVKEDKKEKEEKKDKFDEIFSYDARKYGYFEPEKPKFDEDEEEPQKPGKKKKRKKRRSSSEDLDEWEEW